MNQEQINSQICSAFQELYSLDSLDYDHWLSQLYDRKHNAIHSEWNEENLRLMWNDVESASDREKEKNDIDSAQILEMMKYNL